MGSSASSFSSIKCNTPFNSKVSALCHLNCWEVKRDIAFWIYCLLDFSHCLVSPPPPKKKKEQSVLETEFGCILSVKKLWRASAYPVYFQNETQTSDHILPEHVNGHVLRKFAVNFVHVGHYIEEPPNSIRYLIASLGKKCVPQTFLHKRKLANVFAARQRP